VAASARAGAVPVQGAGHTREITRMKIRVLFRWAKKRMTFLLEIRFPA
jgi:hypothetical protein